MSLFDKEKELKAWLGIGCPEHSTLVFKISVPRVVLIPVKVGLNFAQFFPWPSLRRASGGCQAVLEGPPFPNSF